MGMAVVHWGTQMILLSKQAENCRTFTRQRALRGLKEPVLSGQTLQQTVAVRYVGRILVKKLTRKCNE